MPRVNPGNASRFFPFPLSYPHRPSPPPSPQRRGMNKRPRDNTRGARGDARATTQPPRFSIKRVTVSPIFKPRRPCPNPCEPRAHSHSPRSVPLPRCSIQIVFAKISRQFETSPPGRVHFVTPSSGFASRLSRIRERSKANLAQGWEPRSRKLGFFPRRSPALIGSRT